MTSSRKVFALLLLSGALLATAKTLHSLPRYRLSNFPNTILWAWERKENLEFLDLKNEGVAFLAQTLILEHDEVSIRPRMQPLIVRPGTFLIAVTRIETGSAPFLSDKQRSTAVQSILQTALLRDVKAIQIDFDATLSQRNFYRTLLTDLKQVLPRDLRLSITALASWCVHDNWISSSLVDEAVPMLFQMGRDQKETETFLERGHEFPSPVCRESAGFSTSERLIPLRSRRRLYFFSQKSWSKEALEKIRNEVR